MSNANCENTRFCPVKQGLKDLPDGNTEHWQVMRKIVHMSFQSQRWLRYWIRSAVKELCESSPLARLAGLRRGREHSTTIVVNMPMSFPCGDSADVIYCCAVYH